MYADVRARTIFGVMVWCNTFYEYARPMMIGITRSITDTAPYCTILYDVITNARPKDDWDYTNEEEEDDVQNMMFFPAWHVSAPRGPHHRVADNIYTDTRSVLMVL